MCYTITHVEDMCRCLTCWVQVSTSYPSHLSWGPSYLWIGFNWQGDSNPRDLTINRNPAYSTQPVHSATRCLFFKFVNIESSQRGLCCLFPLREASLILCWWCTLLIFTGKFLVNLLIGSKGNGNRWKSAECPGLRMSCGHLYQVIIVPCTFHTSVWCP